MIDGSSTFACDRSPFRLDHCILPSTLATYMLSPGVSAVPCLRCQLRSVLQRARCLRAEHHRSRPVHRAFSAQQHRYDDQASMGQRERQGYFYRHVSPEGKIRLVGRKGRKQRQVSEPLSIDSLGRKSEVIVLRDFEEKDAGRGGQRVPEEDADERELEEQRKRVSAEDIQKAIAQSDIPADEKEVAASINELRPRDTVLEGASFRRIVKELQDGYTVQQLSGYLQAILARKPPVDSKPSKPKHGTATERKVTISPWRPGRTPLELRPNMVAPAGKNNSLGAKARAADQILRRGWDITVTSEEQEVGELEIKLAPVPYSLLFDTLHKGRPKYEAMIRSPLLLKNSKIQPYRPGNIVRVTARRHDAEEIARRLEAGVHALVKTELRVSDLRPHMDKGPRSRGPRRIFPASDLAWVSRTTQSLVVFGGKEIVDIWSARASEGAFAKRLLVSLVVNKVAAQTELVHVLLKGREYQEYAEQDPFAIVPMHPLEASLQYQQRGKGFGRISMPQTQGEEKKMQSPSLDRIHERMTQLVQARPVTQHPQPSAPAAKTSYWSLPSSAWSAHLGLLLRSDLPNPDSGSGELMTSSLSDSERHRLVVQPAAVFANQVPQFETLFSYMRPRHPSSESVLTAHFIPSPFVGAHNEEAKIWGGLPRVEVQFTRSGSGVLQRRAVRAVLQRHLVDVPLPDQSVDARFARDVGLDAHLPDILEDKEIKSLVDLVATTDTRALSAHIPSELTFKLPAWMGQTSNGTETEDVEVRYWFDHLETSQTIDFVPNTELLSSETHGLPPAVVDLLYSLPQHAYVRYREVDEGVLRGKRTEISLRFDRVGSDVVGDGDVPSKEFLASAVRLANFVTRAARGEVRVWDPERREREKERDVERRVGEGGG